MERRRGDNKLGGQPNWWIDDDVAQCKHWIWWSKWIDKWWWTKWCVGNTWVLWFIQQVTSCLVCACHSLILSSAHAAFFVWGSSRLKHVSDLVHQQIIGIIARVFILLDWPDVPNNPNKINQIGSGNWFTSLQNRIKSITMNLILESWLINFQKPKQTNQSNVINLDFLLPLSPKTNQSYNTPDCCGSSFIGMVVKLESTQKCRV